MYSLYTRYLKIIPGYVLPVLLTMATSFSLFSQPAGNKSAMQYLETRGEVYFKFVHDNSDLEALSKIISIDRMVNDTIYAYANKKEFSRFLEKNPGYTILTPPSLLLDESKLKTGYISKDWDSYPAYDAYVAMMNAFADNYPDLCQLYEIGTTVNGRKLLCVKISDYVGVKEPEPEFFFTSTMHGDEVTGYILTLHLIDYLLSNYESLSEVRELVNNIEIWINPNANPDGTYFSGNNSVSGATRGNANSVDLNRNFPDPDPVDGEHPDGEDWQPETAAMMLFMNNHHFTFSANYHGGAEVMNYPWDTWSRSHPDEAWFRHVSYQYADTAKKYGGSSYFSSVVPDGVTNGYDWYPISGGRQDYTTYFCHGREITIEVSNVKMPPAASLPLYWDYNRVAMLDYIGQCLKGIHGTVTDSVTGEPLMAKIFVWDHDADSSQVYSDPVNGDYHRLIAPGTYTVKCSAPGYRDKIAEDVILNEWNASVDLNFELHAGRNPVEWHEDKIINEPTVWFGSDNILYLDLQEPQAVLISLYDLQGVFVESKIIHASAGRNYYIFENNKISSGICLCRIAFEKNAEKTLLIQLGIH